MRETTWVIGVILLCFAGVALQALPDVDWLRLGRSLMLASASVGIPLELLYFGALAVALQTRHSAGAPSGWYWRPFDQHGLLSSAAKCVVLPFYYGGAAAFVAVIVGVLMVVVAMIAGLRGVA
jgi:hypothetical protein